MISKTHSQEGSRGPIRYPSYQVGGRGSAVVLWAGCCCARRPVSPAFREIRAPKKRASLNAKAWCQANAV